MINAGWRKMVKYYKLTSESPAYVAAIVLNPNLKWSYIRHNWEEAWVTEAEPLMAAFWEKQYKPQGGTPVIAAPVQLTPSTSLSSFMQGHQWVQIAQDEYVHYCQQDTTIGEDPLQWWLQPTQKVKYPNLSQMAIDILTIPPMSAEPERIFSGSKLTLTDQRNRLGVELLRAFECMKSWHKLKGFEEVILAEVDMNDFV